MLEQRPTFGVRKNPGSGWEVDILWPDGETEVIKGFIAEYDAANHGDAQCDGPEAADCRRDGRDRQRQNPISLPVAPPVTIIDGTSILISLGLHGLARAFG
jgi:hypothetical protein